MYSVTTGISSDPTQKPGKSRQILGNLDYENLKFDRSPDGKASQLCGQIEAIQEI
ncbi:MAG: hypothetical protein MUE44_20430 [Oscillatoriaceae cyanobacterium Prado104]|nr:hypothetical protein [Oscillatoriaceae cyanobacterium Prado104]